MVTKDYLNQIKRLNLMISNKLVELEQLQTMATSVTVSSEKENVKSSGDQDRLGSAVAKIVDMENEIDALIDKYVARKKDIISQIDTIVDDRYYNILTSRYVHGWSYEKIADSMNYSMKQVKRLHSEALNEFERKYGSVYKNVS